MMMVEIQIYDSLEQDDVLLQGKGPAHRAGHTATKVDRRIFLLGGSHGVEYKNDFYILDTIQSQM